MAPPSTCALRLSPTNSSARKARSHRARSARSIAGRRNHATGSVRRSLPGSPTSTFSRHVRRSSTCGVWNVRSTPLRETPPGLPRAMRRPSTFTVPDALTRPVRALMNVDLPEPFGPISPTISWSPTVSETPFTATTPPKRTVMSVASSTLDPPPRDAADARHAAREGDDDKQHKAGVEEVGVLLSAAEQFRKVDDHGSPDDRTVNRVHAAEQHHQQDTQRDIDAEGLQ